MRTLGSDLCATANPQSLSTIRQLSEAAAGPRDSGSAATESRTPEPLVSDGVAPAVSVEYLPLGVMLFDPSSSEDDRPTPRLRTTFNGVARARVTVLNRLLHSLPTVSPGVWRSGSGMLIDSTDSRERAVRVILSKGDVRACRGVGAI